MATGGPELVAERVVQHHHSAREGRPPPGQRQVHDHLLQPGPGVPGGAGGAGPDAGAGLFQCIAPLARQPASQGHAAAHGLL